MAPAKSDWRKGDGSMPKAARKKIEVQARVAEGEKLARLQVDGIEHLVRAEDAEVERLIAEGCRVTAQIEALQEKLKELKERAACYVRERGLLAGRKNTKLIGLAGLAEISLRQELKITDPPALKEALGLHYSLCVTEEITYKPTKRLRDLLVDADHPQAPVLRAAVAVRETEYVRFVPKE